MRLEQAMTTECEIRVEGVFDGPAARRLEAVLAQADGTARFLVDLTRVREFHDFAIAVLGQALTRCRARVTVRGLRRHQMLVLRCFGVDAGPLETAVEPDAA